MASGFLKNAIPLTRNWENRKIEPINLIGMDELNHARELAYQE